MAGLKSWSHVRRRCAKIIAALISQQSHIIHGTPLFCLSVPGLHIATATAAVLPWQRAPVSDESHQSRVLDDEFVVGLNCIDGYYVCRYVCMYVYRLFTGRQRKHPVEKSNYNNPKIKVQTLWCLV